MGTIHLYKERKGMAANILIMLIGILLTFFWPQIWNHFLFKQFEIRPGTFINKFWKDQPLMYFDTYLFNWTNHEDFTNHSIKPKFEELGPYRYEIHAKMVNITYHDNSTVSYKKMRRFNFVPEQSRGKLDDIVISPNIIAFGTSNQAKSFNIIKLKGVEWSLAFFGQEITVTKTISELLFEGYEDSMIGIASEIGKIMGYEIPFEDRVGWYLGRNESTRLFNSYNIDARTSHLGQIRHFSGITKPKFLETNCENFQEASAGELFPPHIAKNSQQISFYTEEMCRSMDLDFEEDVEVNGIKGRKFIGGERMIDNGTKYPKNKCYCNGECVRSGVLNSTACRLGVPVFASYPHFYKADPYYLEQIDGMKPEKEKHEFFVTLEPTTSLVLKASARVQVNILMKPIPRIKMYSNVPTKFLPIMWIEQSFEINNQMAFMMKLMLWTPLIGQIIGSIITIISIYLIYRLNNAKEKDEKCLNEKDKNNGILKNGVAELRPLVNENNNNVNIPT